MTTVEEENEYSNLRQIENSIFNSDWKIKNLSPTKEKRNKNLKLIKNVKFEKQNLSHNM